MMKKGAILCAAVVGAAAAVVAVQILCEQVEPPERVITDMVHREARPALPPPPGAVPHICTPRRTPQTDAPALFARHCAACHGADGTGRSYVATRPGMPEVNDLTASEVSPEELSRTLTEGRGAMPAHADRLTEQERNNLIHYILHTLKKK